MHSSGVLSSIEIRQLLLDTLAYEDDDIDAEGKTFKKYGYQGTQSDLFRLMEGLAIKRGLICNQVELSGAAWGGSGNLLHANYTTNFSNGDIINIYEQFHLLLNQGIIAPGALGNYGPDLPNFHVTEYGKRCLRENEILPYDVDGYLEKVRNIPDITDWVKFYIEEALQCFNANCMEAAVIMLGLASEKIINEQIDSILLFFNNSFTDEHGQMSGELISARTISSKYSIYIKYLNLIRGRIVDPQFTVLLPEMDRLAQNVYANFTRITRNGLAHPADTRMERIEVLMIFISFVKYCKSQYSFINYFLSH